MRHIARRITGSPPKNYGMFARARATGRSDLIHLELGQPVHDTPAIIKEATIAALNLGHVHYGDLRGDPGLRASLARKLARHNEIIASPDQILVTNGLTQGSFAALLAITDPGDEIIMLEPYYPQHIGKIGLAGGRVISAPLDAKRGYAIDPDAIAARVTARTKAIILVNPCNPTGRVYTRDELEALAAIAISRDLIVIADEVYEQIVFDDARHISIASLPGMAERCITLFAFTKAYAMDGWRLGYAVASPALIEAMLTVTANEVTHVNSFIQFGALAAVELGDEALATMLSEDDRRRRRVVEALDACPGMRCPLPKGGIYAFPDISATGRTSQEIVDALLRDEGVVLEAGSFYGPAGEGHLRLCFGTETSERLDEALQRIRRFFAKH